MITFFKKNAKTLKSVDSAKITRSILWLQYTVPKFVNNVGIQIEQCSSAKLANFMKPNLACKFYDPEFFRLHGSCKFCTKTLMLNRF